jgi:phosphoribosylformylglycinamidine synthase subunit PurQ / glutaminase
MKFGVLQFPGSNCDQDAFYAVRDVLKLPVEYLWHKDTDLRGSDVIIAPGGFSYGDYLRCGAIANFSPIMGSVKKFAARGGLVVGVCNGFQVLCEAHLLPGALVRNEGLHFVCRLVQLRVENAVTPFTRSCKEGQILSLPVAHGEGKYVCDSATLESLKANNQVLLRYAAPSENPNGSMDNIAGVANATFNVFGLMPHPERACDLKLGSGDGLFLLRSLLQGMK